MGIKCSVSEKVETNNSGSSFETWIFNLPPWKMKWHFMVVTFVCIILSVLFEKKIYCLIVIMATLWHHRIQNCAYWGMQHINISCVCIQCWFILVLATSCRNGRFLLALRYQYTLSWWNLCISCALNCRLGKCWQWVTFIKICQGKALDCHRC